MAQTPPAPEKIPAAPKGLFLFGTDNKVYTVKDASQLTLVKEGIDGFAITDGKLEGMPEPADVVGHDMKELPDGTLIYHRHPHWGHVHVFGRGHVYALHYHPYGTHFAVVLQHHHSHHW